MKIKKYSILISFIGLWLNSFFSDKIQIILGFILILTFGIIHGANDLKIIEKVYFDKLLITKFQIALYYLSILLFTIVLFYFIPFLALLFFIFISGFHFGEQHWKSILKDDKTINLIFFTVYGLFIFSLLFFFNTILVQKIIKSITSITINAEIFEYFIVINSILLAVMTIFLWIKNSDFKNRIVEELLYLLVLIIIFKVSSLIWGFTIYFIIWHTFPSIHDQIKFIYKENSTSSLIKYLKDGILYWIMAIIGLAIFYHYLHQNNRFETLFFLFLAAITFPHVFVMIIMNKKLKS